MKVPGEVWGTYDSAGRLIGIWPERRTAEGWLRTFVGPGKGGIVRYVLAVDHAQCLYDATVLMLAIALRRLANGNTERALEISREIEREAIAVDMDR